MFVVCISLRGVVRLVVLAGFSGCSPSDLWWLGGCGVYVDGLFIVCKFFVNALHSSCFSGCGRVFERLGVVW